MAMWWKRGRKESTQRSSYWPDLVTSVADIFRFQWRRQSPGHRYHQYQYLHYGKNKHNNTLVICKNTSKREEGNLKVVKLPVMEEVQIVCSSRCERQRALPKYYLFKSIYDDTSEKYLPDTSQRRSRPDKYNLVTNRHEPVSRVSASAETDSSDSPNAIGCQGVVNLP